MKKKEQKMINTEVIKTSKLPIKKILIAIEKY